MRGGERTVARHTRTLLTQLTYADENAGHERLLSGDSNVTSSCRFIVLGVYPRPRDRQLLERPKNTANLAAKN